MLEIRAMKMTLVLMCIAAPLAGAAGGAVTGVLIAGKAMGNELAAFTGGFFALGAVVPAAIAAALIHAFL
jgi:hypothetical protein